MFYFTDLDGTLLNSAGELSEYSKRQLNNLLETKKISFFTARSYPVAKRLLDGVDWKFPCVVNNGAFIVDVQTGEILDAQYISNESVKLIIDAAARLRMSYILLCMYNNEEKMVYSELNNAGIEEFINQRMKKKDKRLMKLCEDFSWEKTKVFSLQFVDTYERISALHESIFAEDIVIYRDRELYVDGFYYLNINNIEATKEKALLKVMKKLNIKREEVTAFGDQINDIKMLELAGTGIAVANANTKLKIVADYVIGNNDEDSVVKYIATQAV